MYKCSGGKTLMADFVPVIPPDPGRPLSLHKHSPSLIPHHVEENSHSSVPSPRCGQAAGEDRLQKTHGSLLKPVLKKPLSWLWNYCYAVPAMSFLSKPHSSFIEWFVKMFDVVVKILRLLYIM